MEQQLDEKNTITHDELLVTWDGVDDPENPKNWTQSRKWSLTLLSSFGSLICLMSSTMLAPALGNIADDLHISRAEANMTLSIFVLAFAVGPMVLAPMAEVFGRRRVWLASSAWYTVWSIAGGFSKTNGLLLASRLLAGLGSSVEYAVATPLLGDIWRPEDRGHSFAVATLIPLFGPALGPVLGGLIANSIGWRWLFWMLAIFDATLIAIAYFLWPETYDRLLLHRKASKLSRETGLAYYSIYEVQEESLRIKLKNGLLRPARLLLTQPIIQVMSVLLAFNFGTLYVVLTSYATLWTTRYHQSVSISGLHYFALVVGYTVASQGGARVTDKLWQSFKNRADGHTAPEYRVPLMIPGSILLSAGLLWFGWAAEAHASWALVDVGAAIFGCGVILSTQAMQQYVMESYGDYMASATAASQLLRSIFAFCFPIFAPSLYEHLGYGWGNTTIALVFLFLGIPSPFILWFWGARLRARGGTIR